MKIFLAREGGEAATKKNMQLKQEATERREKQPRIGSLGFLGFLLCKYPLQLNEKSLGSRTAEPRNQADRISFASSRAIATFPFQAFRRCNPND